ncbi:MAG: hypothetical protein AB7E34_09415 [Acidaminococcaceae bacterium]
MTMLQIYLHTHPADLNTAIALYPMARHESYHAGEVPRNKAPPDVDARKVNIQVVLI